MDQLKSKIRDLRRGPRSRNRYIPESAFFKVMTEDAIRRALVWPSYQREEIVQKIFQQGRKIFGILVLLDLTAQLCKFIEADQLEDAKLPFKEDILRVDIQLSKDQAGDFEEKQWELTAPTFSRSTLSRRLEENTILPYIENTEIGKGAFGTVYEVALDPEHQDLGEVFPRKFARKEFKLDDQRENDSSVNHKKELENLAILNHLEHRNIVGLLASYTHNGRHNLLFELANHGNLAGLLAAERPLQFISDESLVIALAGLSSAVEHVHNFTGSKIDLELIGCHHDLRPRNILVSGSSFILADFGLSTFKPLGENSETPFKHGLDDYLGPECEDLDNKSGDGNGTLHRSSDIWSFGCVIAEVATYMAHGPKGIEQFRQAREHKRGFWSYCQFHHGPRNPSPAVNSWLSELEVSSQTCARLVHLIRKTLLMDQLERPKAKEVTRWLRLASLHEVGATVNSLFCRIRNGADSLDIFLEDTRFDSWRYAVGILHVEDESNRQWGSNNSSTSQFDAILGYLFKLRKNLESRLAQEGNTQRLDLSRLVRINDELHCFLSREQMEMCRQYFNITIMNGNYRLFDQIEKGDASVAFDYELRMRANIEHINQLLERDSASTSRTMLVEANMVEAREQVDGGHYLGVINDSQPPRPVWVEWRKYGQHGADRHVTEKLYGRAARIAELLSSEKPEEFRTLRCSHFFHEDSRQAFGLVFEIPRSTMPEGSVRPVNLRQLIPTIATSNRSQPDLDDRFKLASSLATSLLELHSVGLLHKSLNTSNIVFFPETGSAQDSSIREPYFVGFNHSRPDDLSTFTSGLPDSSSPDYQHPTYLREGYAYRPEFDYYSLGIILLEIGFWRSFTEIAAKYTGLSYEDRRQRLLSDRVPLLRKYMGTEYYEAARCCIQGVFGGTESSPGGRELLLRFIELVVGRLHGCSV